jgi:hypothetical protein
LKTVSNFDGKSHFDDIKALAQQAKEAWFIAPFLSSVEIIELLKGSKIDTVTIITTINSFSDSMKVRNILELAQIREFCITQGISLRICNDNKLHAKIYAFYDNTIAPVGMIVSSANATHSGLRTNHELGILINNANRQNEIVESFKKFANEILLTKFSDILAKAEKYKADNPKQVAQPAFNPFDDEDNNGVGVQTDGDSIDTLSETNTPPIEADIRYFIKPIGSFESPYSDGNTPDPLKLHFPKRNPRSIRIGDILICYAVQNYEKIIGYYRVLSEILVDKTDTRYPYYVKTECLSRAFTSSWWVHRISVTALARKFIADNPSSHVTHAGGKTLGALRYGSGHIRITGECAQFILASL